MKKNKLIFFVHCLGINMFILNATGQDLVDALKALDQNISNLTHKVEATVPSKEIPQLTSAEIEEKKKLRNTKTVLTLTDLTSTINDIKNKVAMGNQNIILLVDEEQNILMDKGYTEASTAVLFNDTAIRELFSKRYTPSWRGNILILSYDLTYTTDKIVNLGWKTINVFSEQKKKKIIQKNDEDQKLSAEEKKDLAEIIQKYSAANYEKLGYKVQDKA